MRRQFGEHHHSGPAHLPAAQSLSTTPESYSTTLAQPCRHPVGANPAWSHTPCHTAGIRRERHSTSVGCSSEASASHRSSSSGPPSSATISPSGGSSRSRSARSSAASISRASSNGSNGAALAATAFHSAGRTSPWGAPRLARGEFHRSYLLEADKIETRPLAEQTVMWVRSGWSWMEPAKLPGRGIGVADATRRVDRPLVARKGGSLWPS